MELPEKIEKKQLPIIIAGVWLLFGIILFHSDPGILANFILIAVMIGVLPYILMSYFEYQRIKSMEDQLPLFLRDIAESQKAGMSLPQALKNAAKVDYGKLTPEIRKMSNQLSWGIPLQEVLERFSQRMKDSKIIRRSMRVLIEAYTSGGNITETMESTATDVSIIKEAEKERKSMMAQHVTMMYIIYFIFIIIVLVLSNTLFPILEMSANPTGSGIGFVDPMSACEKNPSAYCIFYPIFSLLCQMFDFGTGAECYYKALFFSMIVIQGIFTGLVCGQISENSARAGIKHSLILTASGFAIFIITLRLGLV
ncbi:MAG: type II secretion system F family protein [Candidatus Micrarchaeota archaeon]|nr:type II secretion system F family protein [Candidatus Micrarchaeota archaeon]